MNKKLLITILVCIFIGGCSSSSVNKKVKIDTATMRIAYMGDSQVKLYWNKINRVDGYELYRKDSDDNEYQKIKNIEKDTMISYVDKNLHNGETYDYKLRGYQKNKKEIDYGDYSSSVKVSINNKIPAISNIFASTNQVKLKWTKSLKSNGYSIYRKTKGAVFKKLAVVDKNKTTYVDKDVHKDMTYTYKIASETNSKTYMSKDENITPAKVEEAQVLSVSQYPTKNKTYAKLTWESKKDYVYSIMRKSQGENYQTVGQKIAHDRMCSFYDTTAKENKDYTYSIRAMKKVNEIAFLMSSQDQGMTTISAKPKVKVDFTNLHAAISWNPIKDVDGYIILRKNGLNGRFKKIGTVGASVHEYIDVYHNSFTSPQEIKMVDAQDTYLDPSNNSIVYTVRGYKINNHQITYGNYDYDGDFHLEPPSIISVKKKSSTQAIIEWGTVKNAKQYVLYSGYNDNQGQRHWQKIATVPQKKGKRMKQTTLVNKNHTYFTVQAISQKNGKTVYSSYDKGFDISQRKYNNRNVLFFGDSITFGSPYKKPQTRTVFSYPHRVQQLTGVQYYNPSIPGSTYTYSEKTNRSRMIQIAECLKEGRDVKSSDLTKKIKKGDMYVYETDFVNNQIKGRTFKDFDVVLMAAGTNDYLDDAQLGSLNSKSTREFNGAINTIMGYIKKASHERVKSGKKPIKVVFIDLFYSDRTYNYSQRTNRFITKNKIGLTLTDYQLDLNQLINKYKQEGMDVYQYANTTINEDNCPYMTSDNLHMSKYGYTQIGNELTHYLLKQGILK